MAAMRLGPYRLILVGTATFLTLTGCGDSDATEPAGGNETQAQRQPELPYDECQGLDANTVSARVVLDVNNTYEQEALRKAGAPSHVRGITRREILIRGDAILERRTGKTWMKDPQKFDAWQDEHEAILDRDLPPESELQLLLAWKARGQDIPEVVVRIEAVEFSHPGVLSYRYGLVPGAPDQGERWVDDPLPEVSREQAEEISEGPAGSVFLGAAEGWSTRPGNYGGVDCAFYSKIDGDKTHEFCVVKIGRHSVYLHDSDRSSQGERTETLAEIQQGLCIDDQRLSAPSRVDFEDWDN